MTDFPPTEFAVTVVHEPATLSVRVCGELDHDTGDDLIDIVVEHLGDGDPPHEVRVDFHGLTWIDSTGLAALLMVHRRTRAVGATLRLDNRPEVLDRVLRLTNVLDHLTAGTAHLGPTQAQFGRDLLAVVEQDRVEPLADPGDQVQAVSPDAVRVGAERARPPR
ncbi:STAS domain-containing protein [Streptomyces sp. NPDC007162]|uniref:STAS domain-containing protein n=1 Tax=Streptomyces sp. NPDC007162 TaxID=3156917 RepID=UPI00340ABCD8